MVRCWKFATCPSHIIVSLRGNNQTYARIFWDNYFLTQMEVLHFFILQNIVGIYKMPCQRLMLKEVTLEHTSTTKSNPCQRHTASVRSARSFIHTSFGMLLLHEAGIFLDHLPEKRTIVYCILFIFIH